MTVWNDQIGDAPWSTGSIRAFHPVIPVLNPEHNIYVLLFATFMIINTDTSFILELHLKRTKVGKIKLECIFSLWKMHTVQNALLPPYTHEFIGTYFIPITTRHPHSVLFG